MSMIRELWAYSPGETAAIITIAALCGLGMAILVIALLTPAANEIDEVIEG